MRGRVLSITLVRLHYDREQDVTRFVVRLIDGGKSYTFASCEGGWLTANTIFNEVLKIW